MGNTVLIHGEKECVKPMRTRIEAIQRLKSPTTPKGCQSFSGAVNFLSLFYPGLQK